MIRHTGRLVLRRAQPALSRGAFKVLEAKDGQFSFERSAGAERIWCTFNATSQQVTRAIPPGMPNMLWSVETVQQGGKLVMEPFGAAIVKLS